MMFRPLATALLCVLSLHLHYPASQALGFQDGRGRIERIRRARDRAERSRPQTRGRSEFGEENWREMVRRMQRRRQAAGQRSQRRGDRAPSARTAERWNEWLRDRRQPPRRDRAQNCLGCHSPDVHDEDQRREGWDRGDRGEDREHRDGDDRNRDDHDRPDEGDRDRGNRGEEREHRGGDDRNRDDHDPRGDRNAERREHLQQAIEHLKRAGLSDLADQLRRRSEAVERQRRLRSRRGSRVPRRRD